LDEFNAKATFFFVAWVAERYPELVQWTHGHGHEIGTHTYNHTFVYQLDQKTFAESLKKSLDILQPLTPHKIIGHRAPAFSLQRGKKWQFDALKDHGIEYDSSINPHQTE
jgi:peptidoglycan/xylan/chitin deacetylase (PgdA/CDA1 family)